MVKKDEGNEKKTAPFRGRIMQVVEVEEDDATKQKIDTLMPSDDVKDDEEKPDIASAFPMETREEKEESESVSSGEETKEEIKPLKSEDKKDIVSELFDAKGGKEKYPEISLDKKASPFGFVIWALVLISIVAVIGGGLLYFKNRSSSQESVTSSIETPTPTLEPTATETPIATVSGKPKVTPTKISTPSATPKKTGLSVQILNGSGEKGVASTAKKVLEEKGYTVISTGNADNFNYEKTEIIIKEEKISSLDTLKTDLSGSYTIGSTSATLDPKATYDAQVIIGKE